MLYRPTEVELSHNSPFTVCMQERGGLPRLRHLSARVGGALALTLTSLAVLPGVTGTAGAASCLSVGPAGNYSEYTSTGVAEASDTVAGPAAYGGPSNNISGLHVGSGLPPRPSAWCWAPPAR